MMSLKVLHAGDGYSYLTRQVATGDNARARGELMADYYTATGAPAGQWWGKGAELLGVSGEVTEAHMRAAYGEFLNPNADEMIKDSIRQGMSVDAAVADARLGRKPLNFNNDIEFVSQMDERIKDFTTLHRRVPNREEREHLEQRVGTELYYQEHETAPDSDQLTKFIADQKRRQRFPVSGYDMVFTPAKSVSVLWGIGDEQTRQAIMKAHQQAVEESLQWIENEALYSRAGAQGVRHIDCKGATVARFVHWDNRAGDPNLHTHCALLNRVLCDDDVYRTVDGQVLHRAAVTASETYNERVKDLVEQYAGVSFHEVQKSRSGQPVWEVEGIPTELIDGFSRRDVVLERGRELIEDYRKTYHREPSKSVQYRLMEQANLETRQAKQDARSLKEMVESWRAQADSMSTEFDRESVLNDVFGTERNTGRTDWSEINQTEFVEGIVDKVSKQRSVWTRFHIESEVRRQLATIELDSDMSRDELVVSLRDQALAGMSVKIERDVQVPDQLTRADGTSVYRAHGSETFTSASVLTAESELSRAAVTWRINTNTNDALSAGRAVVEQEQGFELSAEQTQLVSHLLLSPSEIAVAVGAAGTGKTTAMNAFARAWEHDGHQVFGLAPSAKAASVLSDSIGVEAVTIASMLHGSAHKTLLSKVKEGDVLLVDEAGMASTRDLHALYEHARARGAFVRMVGDPQQLSSVDAGGILKELADSTNAPILSEIHRFSNDEEAAVSLRLRDGDPTVVDWYEDNDRLVTGLREELPAKVFDAWLDSTSKGNTSLMIAGDNHSVDLLNLMARAHYIDSGVVDSGRGEAAISGGRMAAVGDVVVTRENDSSVRFGHNRSSFVKNGDLWTVAEVDDEGGLKLRHKDSGELVTVSASYARASVQLGYASTIHRSQGMTVDESFILPSYSLDRQGLYVALTRGRHLNKVFVPDDAVPDIDSHLHEMQAPSAREVLETIIGRDGAQVTAHAAIEAARQDFDFVSTKLAYEDLVSTVARDYMVAMSADDETRELLAEDWQTARLAQPLAQLSHSPMDMEWTVRTALAVAKTDWDQRDPEKRPSLAFLVREQLEQHSAAVADTAEDNLLWTLNLPVAPQWERGLDDDMRTYLAEVADRLQDHLVREGERVLDEGAPWLEQLPERGNASVEYTSARKHAVRVVAAAALDTRRDTSNLSEWDEPFAAIIGKAHGHGKQSSRTFFDRMNSVQLRHYIENCQHQQSELAERISELEEARDHYLSLPSYRKVVERHDHAVAMAEKIVACRDLDERVQAAQQQANDTDSQIRIEQARGRLTRSASTIQSLHDKHREQLAEVAELRTQHRAVAVGLPARAQWDTYLARAHNAAQWEHDKESAWMEDIRVVDSFESRMESVHDDVRLWNEKQQVAETFVKGGQIDPELRAKLVGDMRRKLEDNRKKAAAEPSVPDVQPSAESNPPEVGPRLAAFRAERARRRAEREGEQPDVRDVFREVTRNVTESKNPVQEPQPVPVATEPADVDTTTPPQPDPAPDSGVDL